MNAKKKGNKGEQRFSAFLRSHGFRAFKEASSGAYAHKGDIVNDLNFTIEVKTVKRINLKQAWDQVDHDASMARNSPLLVIRFDGMPKDEWLCVLHSEDLVEFLKAQNNTQDVVENNPQKKYAVVKMVEDAKRVIKLFE